MIPIKVLDYLISQRIKDAEVLLKAKRHSTAIYIMGYAVEYVLKKKICSTLSFTSGFPENRIELGHYITALSSSPAFVVSPISFTNINEIKSHDLNKLLVYSGAEPRIKALFLTEWADIAFWDPKQRYVRQRFTTVNARQFVKAAKKIIKEIK